MINKNKFLLSKVTGERQTHKQIIRTEIVTILEMCRGYYENGEPGH